MKKFILIAMVLLLSTTLFATSWKTIKYDEKSKGLVSVTRQINIDDKLKIDEKAKKGLKSYQDSQINKIISEYTKRLDKFNLNMKVKLDIYDNKLSDGRFYRISSTCFIDLNSGFKQYEIDVEQYYGLLNEYFNLEKIPDIKGKTLNTYTAYSPDEAKEIVNYFIRQYCED